MSMYVNNLLNSVSDEFIQNKYKNFRILEEKKKHKVSSKKIVFDRLYKKREK